MSELSNKLKAYFKKVPLLESVYSGIKYPIEALHKSRYNTISQQEFVNDVKIAIEKNIGYAAGKIGKSPQHWMYYEIVLKKEKKLQKIQEFEKLLLFHGFKQSGVFPANLNYYLEFNEFYIEQIKNLDSLGIFYYPPELEIIGHYQLKNKIIYFQYQEPERESPSDEKNCYLQYFKDKKVLLICPFAEILKERATKDIFEGIWSKTGKKWFYPNSVEALELPYGFVRETQEKYSTAVDLLRDITREIDNRDFDVALIAAAGLAIPIASHVKNLGKIGIDLGGHLQILFGVLGKRWRERQDWQEQYFNDYWIDMPAKYKPKQTDVCDAGAYW